MSAFQALGPFISTFANPNMTGLYFDQDGILRVQESENVAATVTSIKPPVTENKPEKAQPDTAATTSASTG